MSVVLTCNSDTRWITSRPYVSSSCFSVHSVLLLVVNSLVWSGGRGFCFPFLPCIPWLMPSTNRENPLSLGQGDQYVAYHDTEWGVPVHDDRRLFEFLILEGAQAGLSWVTILKKRENYREAFDNFDPTKVARYDRSGSRERCWPTPGSSATG